MNSIPCTVLLVTLVCFFVCVTYVRHFDFTLSFRESEVRPSRTSSGGWRNVTATAVRDTPLAETVTEHVTDAAGWPEYKRARLDARSCLDELVKTNECSVS